MHQTPGRKHSPGRSYRTIQRSVSSRPSAARRSALYRDAPPRDIHAEGHGCFRRRRSHDTRYRFDPRRRPYSGYEPTDQGGNCMCFPIPDPSAEGMPCELGDVNAFWGVCEPGLTCVGLLADGSNGDCPNGIPDCSSIPSSWNPFCDKNTNHCGASFCAKECDAGACEAGFIPFNYGATCYCAPEG